MKPNKLINYAARFEYLAATEQLRPSVLNSLRSDVLPVYQRCFQKYPQATALQNLVQLLSAVRKDPDTEFRTVAEVLEKWADAHAFRDVWLRDAGLQTMHWWFHGGDARKWGYFPEDFEGRRFQPEFGLWIPSFSSWPDFKKATDRVYRKELKKYRTAMSAAWGSSQTKLDVQAKWTLLWQLGKSPGAIRNWHLKTTGRAVSEANIQMAVHAFANSAEITLRSPKAGRRARKI